MLFHGAGGLSADVDADVDGMLGCGLWKRAAEVGSTVADVGNSLDMGLGRDQWTLL